MSRGETGTPAPTNDATDCRVQGARAAWRDVRIDTVETRPCERGCCVHAVVHLARLTPADVVVRLAPAAQAAAQDWPAEWRMWSVAPYDNGCFLFEQVIPRGADTTREWVVAVHPTGAAIGRPIVYPLRIGDAAHAPPR